MGNRASTRIAVPPTRRPTGATPTAVGGVGMETGEPCLPLAGTKLCLVETGSEAQRAGARAAAQRIGGMGGRLVPHVRLATHVCIPDDLGLKLGPTMLATLREAYQCRVPIVETGRWLSAVESLMPGQQWSEIHTDEFVPLSVAFLYERTSEDRASQESGRVLRDRRQKERLQFTDELASSLDETWAFMKREARSCSISDTSGHQMPNVLLSNAPEAEVALAQDKPSTEAKLTEEPSLPAPQLALREHRALIDALFDHHGADAASFINRQARALSHLQLSVYDAGSCNHNEAGVVLNNQCFYLSLAAASLSKKWSHDREKECNVGGMSVLRNRSADSDGRETDQTRSLHTLALIFKRTVEQAVLRAHPEWAGSHVGEEVQAFSDFLCYALHSQTSLSHIAVAIFDAESGFVDIYKGIGYQRMERALVKCQAAHKACSGWLRPTDAIASSTIMPQLNVTHSGNSEDEQNFEEYENDVCANGERSGSETKPFKVLGRGIESLSPRIASHGERSQSTPAVTSAAEATVLRGFFANSPPPAQQRRREHAPVKTAKLPNLAVRPGAEDRAHHPNVHSHSSRITKTSPDTATSTLNVHPPTHRMPTAVTPVPKSLRHTPQAGIVRRSHSSQPTTKMHAATSSTHRRQNREVPKRMGDRDQPNIDPHSTDGALEHGEREDAILAGLRSNLLTIRYVPGHYQALIGGSQPTLAELIEVLDAHDILHVTTDG